jgi:hypothetical protein
MKKFLTSLLFLGSLAWGQNSAVPVSGPITAASATCPVTQGPQPQCVFQQLPPSVGQLAITVESAPTFSATLQFEWSPDGGNTWVALTATANGGGTATSTTTSGVWVATLPGGSFVRVRASAYTSGTAQVFLNPSQAAVAGSSGGSGTVNNGTTAGCLAYYALTGTAVSCDPGVVDSSGNGSLVLGGAGVGAGNLTLDGSTSGSVTLSCSPATTCAAFTTGKLIDFTGYCKIGSAGVTLSTSATTICTLGNPGNSTTWSWLCSGTYSITAGTTPTLALGITYAQTPVSETGNARIASALNPIVESAGSVTATTTGNQLMLTGTTVTANNLPWSSSGTLQASVTPGAFSLYGVLGGTTPAGTINPGSTCIIY